MISCFHLLKKRNEKQAYTQKRDKKLNRDIVNMKDSLKFSSKTI